MATFNIISYVHFFTCMHVIYCYCTFVVPVRISGIVSSADDCLILEESNTLTCILDGLPQPTIHWYIGDDNTLSLVESSEKSTIRGDQLVISNVSISDINTFYGCAAHNFAGGVMQMDNFTQIFPACSKPCLSCISKCAMCMT